MQIKETEVKWERVRNILREKKLDGVIINKISNFAWFTGGNNFVAINTENGASSLLVTEKKIYLVSNNIEANRIKDEEIKKLPIDDIICQWYQDDQIFKMAEKIIGGKIGIDRPGENYEFVDISKIHLPLLDTEVERFKNLGQKVTKIVSKVCHEISCGMTEIQVAGNLANYFWAAGTIPVVLLIAADERISNYRHPVATDKKIEKYVMVVVCVYEKGLIVSMTRLVSFGKLPEEIKLKHKAVCQVDATFISLTAPNRKICDVFKSGIETYGKTGYPEEWKKHHQGGPCGYKTRYYRATEKSTDIIKENYAFAWNPSITGTKSEDTIIVGKNGPEIITQDPQWPKIDIEVGGICIPRPDILFR
ncbi:MAG: aminopeptidase P family N-terminal domain-containing protein [Candidatus Omnitrophica bacterium]|nr:aminopeptidase P family N-terminal domain-containing protein [Candidatus Omnitrophota bacterium]